MVRRQGFTLMETLVSLLIVLAFCELATLVVHHTLTSKDT
ncbi:prepilin-type N-terminal cleavage/methylation domain-containing protein [Schleiferilactobacillus harbinensis]|nr:prepilin-type N-terminal cleavage/methylation domain-containing protein [Schleiferilactobacillus harbinensis]